MIQRNRFHHELKLQSINESEQVTLDSSQSLMEISNETPDHELTEGQQQESSNRIMEEDTDLLVEATKNDNFPKFIPQKSFMHNASFNLIRSHQNGLKI